MHNKILFLALALLILSSILAGSWFYVANSKTTILPAPTPSGQTQASGKSGVFGRALIGPTCPLYQPDLPPQCQDKPIQAEIIVTTQDRNQEVGRIKTDKDGSYKIALAPGTYILETSPQKTGIARGMPQSVTIEADKFTELNLHFDSGIR